MLMEYVEKLVVLLREHGDHPLLDQDGDPIKGPEFVPQFATALSYPEGNEIEQLQDAYVITT